LLGRYRYRKPPTNFSEEAYFFDIEPAPKDMLVEGLDPIALTLQHQDRIDAFEREHRQRMPWLA
ncbi:MAG: hypothetical protein WD005_03970, partial [Haliea sp.]